jgi:hypothetical protein
MLLCLKRVTMIKTEAKYQDRAGNPLGFHPTMVVSQMDYSNIVTQCVTDERAGNLISRVGTQANYLNEPFAASVVSLDPLQPAVDHLGAGWKFPEWCHIMELLKQIQTNRDAYGQKNIALDLRTFPENYDPLYVGPREELCITLEPKQPVRLVSKVLDVSTDCMFLVKY